MTTMDAIFRLLRRILYPSRPAIDPGFEAFLTPAPAPERIDSLQRRLLERRAA